MINLNASITVPEVAASTYPQGPKGIGISSFTQNGNIITVTFDDGSTETLTFPDWWFGTMAEYNAMTDEEKSLYTLHFIEE